jgi:hypothetical protein
LAASRVADQQGDIASLGRVAGSQIRTKSAPCRTRRSRRFGRCGTDGNGGYVFDTIKLGVVPNPDGEAGNATDPALASADRPATLIGKLKAGGANVTYSLDIDPQATPRRYSSTFGDGIGIFRLSYLHLAGAGSNWTMMDWNERSYFSIS